MSTITFVTDEATEVDASGAVGLLCEAAPDGILGRKFPHAVRPRELFGDYNETKHQAYVVAKRLLRDEPPLRGLQQLGVFEDLLIRRIEFALHVVHLIDWLKANRFTTCVFLRPSAVADCLCILSVQDGIEVKVPMSIKDRSPLIRRIKRVYARIRDSAFSRQSIRNEWREFLDYVDPYHRRRLLRPWARRQRSGAGGIWFYSTAYTFSRIALAYEPYFPSSFNFLIEDSTTGGGILAANSRPSVSIYEFSSPDLAPSRDEAEEAANTIELHLRKVALSGTEARAREIVMESWIEEEFRKRLLPLGLYQTELFEEWARQCNPKALVVGNPVFEAYALVAARKRGVPTILLQHGILGDYCQFTDPPVDSYIVRGEFWRNFLAEQSRKRSKVLNFPAKFTEPLTKPEPRKSILFLTTWFIPGEFWVESDVGDVLDVLLKCAVDRSCELIVRVHPMETMEHYRRRIEMLMPNDAHANLVTYSQGGSLDSLLARSAVAITYASTAFLDCLRWQVPIVSFDWQDFSYKDQIRDYGVFHFAHSLAELSDLVLRSLSAELPPYQGGVEPFLASTTDVELAREIERMVSGKRSAATQQAACGPEAIAGANV